MSKKLENIRTTFLHWLKTKNIQPLNILIMYTVYFL